MNKIISSDVFVAYSQCPRKAYLLLFTKQKGKIHEYTQILQQQKISNQHQYINALKQKQSDVQPFVEKGLKGRCDFLVEATLQVDGFSADCGLLAKVKSSSALGRYSYEPTIFAGTHTVTKEQRLQVIFAGYILGQIQKQQPVAGRIIRMESKSTKVKLEDNSKTLIPILEPLQEWVNEDSPEAPPVILSKHCSLCQFRSACQAKAEQEDNLSLLDRMTPKMIRQYEKKGIFTVKQLSYLYKPRKRKKRVKNPPKPMHKIELQALAIRTEKIYLEELPELTRQPVELFLDLEGVPDQGLYYLIGLLVCEGDSISYHSFWADCDQNEEPIWRQFLEKVKQYPDAPIYHYGSYEPKAVATLARRYETDSESLTKRLVNVNNHIYGKVYFPVRSNGLKAIGEFIGAKWTSPDASGLQSLVWRHRWDETQNAKYQELLVTYNEEDCQALNALTEKLSKIKHSAGTLSEVDFAVSPKQRVTESSRYISSQFKSILQFAHFGYDKKKISFRQEKKKISKEDLSDLQKQKAKLQHQKILTLRRRTKKTILIPHGETCPKCGNKSVKQRDLVSKRFIIDLVLTRNGIRKTLTQYVGIKGYCQKCKRCFAPLGIRKYSNNQIYGQGFSSWVVYQRVAMRLPYESIVEMVMEYFKEKITVPQILKFMQKLADYYSETEDSIFDNLLKSSFIHADETKVNIKGFNWYVWVFTNDKYVIFKLSETREAVVAQEFLASYEGILISDFYPGYDSLNCRQQKCWVHLIRDLNDDLRKNPFDKEYEIFVLEIKNLIIPVMETIQKYGLKERNLNKFRKQVKNFYAKVIVNKLYRSDLALKYQKRFIRYENSLFTFLEEDGILWHNNTAERAIRPFAIQRDISKSPLHESSTRNYLVLLGIRQTCRFQGKSFFKFLFSGETDIDQFQRSKRSRKV